MLPVDEQLVDIRITLREMESRINVLERLDRPKLTHRFVEFLTSVTKETWESFAIGGTISSICVSIAVCITLGQWSPGCRKVPIIYERDGQSANGWVLTPDGSRGHYEKMEGNK